MRTLLASLGCLGFIAMLSAFVLLASTHGKWGYVALEVAGVALIVARIGAGHSDG